MALPADLRVRTLALEDLDSALELVGRCDVTYLEWAPSGWEAPDLELDRRRWEEGWDQPDRWASCAVDRAGKLIAIVSWRGERGARGRGMRDVARVSALFVDPRRWREGIAAALIRLAEASMVAKGYRLARLWTPERAPARHFYDAEGWHEDGRDGWHEVLGLPIVGYEKRLPSPKFRTSSRR